MKKLLALGLTLVLVAVLLAGCLGDEDRGTDERLVGTWHYFDMIFFAFNANGTGHGNSEDIPLAWSTSDDILYITWGEGETALEEAWTFVYNGDTLEMVDEWGSEMTLTREPQEWSFEDPGDNGDWTPPAEADEDLAGYINQIIGNFNIIGTLPPSPLTEENFAQMIFIDYIDGARGAISQAAMTAQPHIIILVELPEGTNAATVVSNIESRFDPNMWICAEAEIFEVHSAGNYVLVIATNDDWYQDSWVETFENLFN